MNQSIMIARSSRNALRRTSASSSLVSFQSFTSKSNKGTSADKKDKKENFAKKFLEPAARGQLNRKHQSGIPKLAGRKSKGHSLKEKFDGKEMTEGGEGFDAESFSSDRHRRKDRNHSKRNKTRGSTNRMQQMVQREGAPENSVEALFEPVSPHVLDPTTTEAQEANLRWLGKEVKSFELERTLKGGRNNKEELDEFDQPIEQAEIDNPWVTDAISFSYDKPIPESRREARPIVHPTNRVNPPVDFVEQHKVFMYVSGVPRPVMDDGKLGYYKNDLDKHEVANSVANILGVPVTSVFPATMNSAFVGFENAKDAADKCLASRKKRILQYNITTKVYDESKRTDVTEDEKSFVASSSTPSSIILVEDIHPGFFSGTIARLLRPARVLDASDIFFPTPTSFLIRMEDPEAAMNLNQSNEYKRCLSLMEKQKINVQVAKREVVHDKWGGPANEIQIKKLNHTLVVDGDVPSSSFFLSHTGVLHLCNVPSNVNKLAISEIFQPYCTDKRDVRGSVEIVKTIDGDATGRVYVGFDLDQDYQAALAVLGQKVSFSNTGLTTRIRPVKDKRLLRGEKIGSRTERSEEELLYALQNSWMDHVDPKDLKFLEAHGVSKDVLEEAFLAARYENPSFGLEDDVRIGERLRDNGTGESYRDFVKLYIETLMEVIATKEKPGAMYEGMFMSNEPIDHEFLEREEKRIANLQKEHYDK